MNGNEGFFFKSLNLKLGEKKLNEETTFAEHLL